MKYMHRFFSAVVAFSHWPMRLINVQWAKKSGFPTRKRRFIWHSLIEIDVVHIFDFDFIIFYKYRYFPNSKKNPIHLTPTNIVIYLNDVWNEVPMNIWNAMAKCTMCTTAHLSHSMLGHHWLGIERYYNRVYTISMC